MKTKPSDYNTYPWNSIIRKSEAETIAMNIMVILKRTGDTFRELDYQEYKQERLKDGNYSDEEKFWFDKVIKYCKSSEMAARFSAKWS
jgi:hypothetical protein